MRSSIRIHRNFHHAGNDGDRGSREGSQGGGTDPPQPQQRRPSSPPPRSDAFLKSLSDENSSLARFLLRGRSGGEGRGPDDDRSWLTRSRRQWNSADGSDAPIVGMEGAFYPLMLEPLEKRNERIIMAFEAYAVFGALFLSGVWIIYEWGSPKWNFDGFGDSGIDPDSALARAYKLIMALALAVNAMLTLFGAGWWVFSIFVNSSHEDYTIQAIKPLAFLQYLLVATTLLVFLGLILGIYCNLNPNLPETAVAIVIVTAIYFKGSGIHVQFLWATIPLEVCHWPSPVRWILPQYWRKQGREDLRARAELRAEDLARRASRERKRLGPDFGTKDGDASPLEAYLSKATSNLGLADRDISPFVAQMHRDWYTQVDDLKGRNVDFLAHYMPRKLAEEVHRLAEFENSDKSCEERANI